MPEPLLDFDVSPGDERGVLNLVRTAYDIANDHQYVRDAQCERDYQNFHGFVNVITRIFMDLWIWRVVILTELTFPFPSSIVF
jgi:hypothetical protein